VNLQDLLARAKSMLSAFSTAQLISLVVSFVLVVGIVAGSAYFMNRPNYVLLFSDMDADSAGQVVTRLKTLKVPYLMDDGGRGIRVPSSRVDELRLELATNGLPASGRVGFEIFDRTAFGATEFLEQVNYRRALEGEIARTIATLAEVSSARVHIAMGKEAVFGEPRPAKASVVLKLRGQRSLSAGTINGITNLVAASVEGLGADAVVILDSFGRPLARPNGDNADDPLGAAHLERQARMERDMAARVTALLEPVVGADRVRVNVAIKLNPQTKEETEERWDPNAVIRSRQMTADGPGAATASGGIAGARSNTPPPTTEGQQPPTVPPLGAIPPAITAAVGGRAAETTNFEISRMTRHTHQPPGDVARLSVAVILDDDQAAARDKAGLMQVKRSPRTTDELRKIQGLVAAAVGLEPDRGDQLTVENVAFDEPLIEDAPALGMLERVPPQVWEGGRIAVIAGIAILGLLLLRPMLRPTKGTLVPATSTGPAIKLAPPGAPAKTVSDIESEIEAQLDATESKGREARRLPVLTRRVTELSAKEPENVARLLRSWMNEEDR
jgi:flagellar M-ring protein FliF